PRMPAMQGMWQAMAIADVNADGHLDLVLGNLGLNGYLRPDSTNPVKLWFADFDNNRLFDKVMTRTINGRDMPVFLKRDLTDQIPGLKKQNLQFEAYATKSIQDLFGAESLQQALVHTCNQSASGILYNLGNGSFSFSPFAPPLQWSSINALCTTDLNGDGLPDLLMGGNQYAMMPQFGRLDASFGHVLLNGGRGQWQYLPTVESGINIRGAIKDIKAIKGKAGGYLWLRNNQTPVLVRVGKLPALNKTM
ncbi:MAG TPA: VCBS repeat-containing protein, partial [Phnomibacter sp.]|nr:VCBS repeat-containing protein [Phnomibacter sp.]